MQNIYVKIYITSVFLCKTPAAMLKKSVSPSGERAITFVFYKSIIIALTVSLGRPYAIRICSIFPLLGTE